jgi:cobalt/nickel transport system ATP-binding protein
MTYEHMRINGGEAKPPIIHIDCVSHIYPDGTIGIHKACLMVFEHEVVSLCGPNGSGKSTVLQHLNGILMPTDGNVQVMGKPVIKKNLEELRKIVGLVFQDADSQLFAPTVLDDVMFGPLNQGLSPEESKKMALWALDTVGFKELTKTPHHLSGGEKRLVAMAGIIAMKPKIIVVDEPTSDLDPVNSEKIEKLLLKLKDDLGMSVVLSTHDMDLAARIANRVYILKNGSVIAEGTPKEIFYNDVLLTDAKLKPPIVVQFYLDLVRDGIIKEGAYPLTLEELTNLVKDSD